MPRRRFWITFCVATVALVVAVMLAVTQGPSSVDAADFLTWMTGGSVSAKTQSIIVNVRLPRVLAGALAGAALACSGALIQEVLDNPLASPNVIGVNSGAGLAVLLASALVPHVLWLPPIAAFAGALVAALIVFGLSVGAGVSRMGIVLAGIAITAVFGAGMNTILIVKPDAYVGASTFLVGGLSGVLLDDLRVPLAIIVCALVCAVLVAGRLNVLKLGDATAHALGMNVNATRICMLCLAALLAGAAVSFAGLLGFVGLIVPHVARFIVGHDSRFVLPVSLVGGAAFVVLCDLAARLLFAPYELPVGILMAFLGGPFFIYLILRNGRRGLD